MAVAGGQYPQPIHQTPVAPELNDFVKHYEPSGQDYSGDGSGLAPEESVMGLNLADGYLAELVAAEPVIRQPIDIQFDARGRIWVVQYLQYPFPAGLTVVSYDKYLRAEYDSTPLPPPHHMGGADKITILDDVDGDGYFELAKTFVEGLNMATSVLPGSGGAWVMQSPYLLFYPDADGDDIPDRDPEVRLSGFGMEDTHSLANNLHWGPDGWIYGATGSTSTLHVRGEALLGQGIWRYHPDLDFFEVFAEGGGNTFSLEFDSVGRAFSGTNDGGTRGLYYEQGANYIKRWSKHGPAQNPFYFGYFDHMKHEGYKERFAQTFVIYENELMPALAGQVVTGMALTNRVQASRLLPDGTTFRTEDSATLLTTPDRAFRPVDLEIGPNGAIYMADWSDLRLTHLDPKDNWDKSSGRIIRLVTEKMPHEPHRDLTRLSPVELLHLLDDPNRQIREKVRPLLAAAHDTVTTPLWHRLRHNAPSALEAFWVLNLRNKFSEADLTHLLVHENPHIRRWSVRLLGDRRSLCADTRMAIRSLSKVEVDPAVISQIICSLRRLPANHGYPILRELLVRSDLVFDDHLQLLIWWTLEAGLLNGRQAMLSLAMDPTVTSTAIFRKALASKIGRRLSADQGPRKYYTLIDGTYSDWVIERAPEYFIKNLDYLGEILRRTAPADRLLYIKGMARGLTGPPVSSIPRSLNAQLDQLLAAQGDSQWVNLVAARLGNETALHKIDRFVRSNIAVSTEEHFLGVNLLADFDRLDLLPYLVEQVTLSEEPAKQEAYLAALGRYNDLRAAETLMELYEGLSPNLQGMICRLLTKSLAWTSYMLGRIEQGAFTPASFPSEALTMLEHYQQLGLIESGSQRLENAGAMSQFAQGVTDYEKGRTDYLLTCAPCHEQQGTGKLGYAPSLVDSSWIQQIPEALVSIILHGKHNLENGLIMPPWKHYDDERIAAITNFVRGEFGGLRENISPEFVEEVRHATADRTEAWEDHELTETYLTP